MRIGIVGAGASGVLVAINLLRRARGTADGIPVGLIEVVLIDPNPPGRGVAYGTRDPRHLLNVRAAGMSALPEDPDHFRAWAGAHADDYLPRMQFADYLQQVLEESAEGSRARLVVVGEQVVDLQHSADGVTLTLANADVLVVDAVVLATGNAPARCPDAISVSDAARDRAHSHPWSLPPAVSGAHTLLLGSGLTAVDVAISRLSAGDNTRVTMVSRHGFLPQPHDEPWIAPNPDPVVTPAEIAAGLPLHEALHRLRSGRDAWRQRVDALRPVTQHLWQTMTIDQKRQFLRHAERFWEVHRHRMPAAIADQLQQWRDQGRLQVVAMDVSSIQTRMSDDGSPATVVMQDRDGREVFGDDWVIATGPASPVAGNGLVSSLVEREVLTHDALGLGLAMDPSSARAHTAAGRTHDNIFVVGPLAKGTLWETTAVPDIRGAAARLAEFLLTEGPSGERVNLR